MINGMGFTVGLDGIVNIGREAIRARRQRIYNDGYAAGEKVGYDRGLNEGGYGRGYDDGYLVGSSEGYQTGFREGYSTGYAEGFRDGANSTSNRTFSPLTDMPAVGRADFGARFGSSSMGSRLFT